MKGFNNIKMISSFKEISNALEIISVVIKIFAILLALLQGLSLINDFKKLSDK